MRRARAVIALALALPALTACGGDEEQTTATPAPTKTPARSAPPSPGALPPEFIECMAERGFEVESADEIHSAPPQVLQECFASLHQGGG